ncbi:MAG: MBL fold metallo-hydrolase [Actinobacteria bacterium]|nr:MBL fold metallo-hydrolase [Actinomycetota bacterium]
MSEPREVADAVELVAAGLYHWRIHNSSIGGHTSSSHALCAGEECVLIDPVRLADEALAGLLRPTAVALTARCHQRAAWRYRRQFDIPVWLPEDATPGDEEPDQRYNEGDILPGGLWAIRTPGPEWAHYSFLLDAVGDRPAVLFCSDLVGVMDGELGFIPPDYHEDPGATRASVERLLELRFEILCLDHGAPLTHDPKAALRRLLETPA